MNWAAIIWLILMIVFILMETTTVMLVSVWFAAGALVALILSLFSLPLPVQVIAFAVVSCGLLALLRPMVQKFLKPKIVKTNVDSVIGSTGPVTVAIENNTAVGQVKLGAMYWTARSTTGNPIPEGTLVRVDRVEGVKVYVSTVEVSAKV
jgi:membrane protein implicated in regulation of membrane protease activity